MQSSCVKNAVDPLAEILPAYVDSIYHWKHYEGSLKRHVLMLFDAFLFQLERLGWWSVYIVPPSNCQWQPLKEKGSQRPLRESKLFCFSLQCLIINQLHQQHTLHWFAQKKMVEMMLSMTHHYYLIAICSTTLLLPYMASHYLCNFSA